MSIFNRFRQPPPPIPIYQRKPIATISVVLVMIGMFVLAPIGVIYDSMSEEIKTIKAEKASRETIQQMLINQEILIKQNKEEGKERDVKNEKQDTAILENQKTLIELRVNKLRIIKAEPKKVIKKKPIPPVLFEKYLLLKPEIQIKYKKYLGNKGYDTEGLE